MSKISVIFSIIRIFLLGLTNALVITNHYPWLSVIFVDGTVLFWIISYIYEDCSREGDR